jgi:cob(I)alamin adenosyltransferase
MTFLRAMQRRILGHRTREAEATHRRLDEMQAALLNLCGTYATGGEIQVMHDELSRMRERVSEIDARTLEPEDAA